MRALRAVRQRKTVVKIGPWRDGKMPRTAFPLSKGHSYSLGSSWRWSVCELEGGGAHYLLMVAFDAGKAQYQAWLGLRDGKDQALIARLEYHPTHRGWHCHVKRGLLSAVSRGVVKEARHRDGCRVCDDGQPFMVSELNGLSIAFRIFRVSFPPPQDVWF